MSHVPSREGNLNVRGAWLHVLTDALGSMLVVPAAYYAAHARRIQPVS